MSFFGLENSTLEDEKRRFQQGGLRADEDIAVYNWGEEDYDGLGSALQEGGDELNDETFGSSGPVGKCKFRIFTYMSLISNGVIGKDFDFTAHTLSEVERPNQTFANIVEKPKVIAEPGRNSIFYIFPNVTLSSTFTSSRVNMGEQISVLCLTPQQHRREYRAQSWSCSPGNTKYF